MWGGFGSGRAFGISFTVLIQGSFPVMLGNFDCDKPLGVLRDDTLVRHYCVSTSYE